MQRYIAWSILLVYINCKEKIKSGGKHQEKCRRKDVRKTAEGGKRKIKRPWWKGCVCVSFLFAGPRELSFSPSEEEGYCVINCGPRTSSSVADMRKAGLSARSSYRALAIWELTWDPHASASQVSGFKAVELCQFSLFCFVCLSEAGSHDVQAG